MKFGIPGFRTLMFAENLPEFKRLAQKVPMKQIRAQVEVRQIGNIRHRSSPILVTRILLALLFAITFWGYIGGWVITLWVIVTVLLTLVSNKFSDDFFNDPNPGKRIEYWKGQTLRFTTISAISLGFAGYYFLGFDDLVLRLVLLAFIFGTSFASISLYARWLPALFVFLPITLIPSVVKFSEIYDFPGAIVTFWICIVLLISFAYGIQLYVIYTRSIFRDFERDLLMEELIQQRQEADFIRAASEAAIAERSRFFAAANHDIRQPIQAMSIFISLLEKKTTEQTKPFVQNISKSAAMISNLVEQILLVTKADSKNLQVNLEKFSLLDLFKDLKEEFQPLAETKGLKFETIEIEEAIISDCMVLERILGNLISNAIRYTSGGTVLLRAKKTPKGSIVITVSDSGAGISKAERDKLFKEYSQGEAGKNARLGFGLGLSIAEKLSEAIGIRLTLLSKEGKGTIFRLDIPMSTDKGFQNLREEAEISADLISLRSLKILLLEDEPLIRESLKVLFESWDASVIDFENYESITQECIEELEDIGLIFSDFSLGVNKTTGLQAIFRLRKRFARNIPAIVSTATMHDLVIHQYNEETENVDSNSLEASFYELPLIIEKPVKPQDINRSIKRLLGTNGLERNKPVLVNSFYH